MKANIGRYPKYKPRRLKIEIEHFDTWNMNDTLAHLIYPMLLQLRDTKHGVPGVLVEDVGGEDYTQQDSFDFYKETHQESWDIAARRWDEVLDKMIWSFSQLMDDDWEAQYFHGKGEYDWVESDHKYPNPITGVLESTYQMVDKNPDDHWIDMEGMDLHRKRIQEGLDLFGKYYQNLWD